MKDAPQAETLDLGLVEPKRKGRGEGVRPVKEAAVEGIRWSKYSAVKREKCDMCIDGIHAGTNMHAPGLAMYRRVQRGETELLCFTHTQERRTADGLAQYKRPGT